MCYTNCSVDRVETDEFGNPKTVYIRRDTGKTFAVFYSVLKMTHITREATGIPDEGLALIIDRTIEIADNARILLAH